MCGTLPDRNTSDRVVDVLLALVWIVNIVAIIGSAVYSILGA